jgi:hypothetical protein
MTGRADPTCGERRGALLRLIEALDRRRPRRERAGEARIGREAADLWARAVALLLVLRETKPGAGSIV